jgi:hypothetical protein
MFLSLLYHILMSMWYSSVSPHLTLRLKGESESRHKFNYSKGQCGDHVIPVSII